MKEDKLESIFEELKGSFDLEEPMEGHRQRFLKKLESSSKRRYDSVKWWRPLAIAASVALICMLGLKLFSPAPTINEQVAKISPEISQTEFYFASLIEEQVQQLESESSPETQKLVDDTLLQLQKLEENYRKLEQDLISGGNSQLILSAMITNFQTRIGLLKDVLQKIETIKNLNPYNDENYTI